VKMPEVKTLTTSDGAYHLYVLSLEGKTGIGALVAGNGNCRVAGELARLAGDCPETGGEGCGGVDGVCVGPGRATGNFCLGDDRIDLTLAKTTIV